MEVLSKDFPFYIWAVMAVLVVINVPWFVGYDIYIYIYIYIYIPFKKSVKTNVAKIFFRLLAKHFPRANKLYKIFNRNAAKVSCSCKENVCQIIKKHNNYVSRKKAKSTPSCNCRKKDDYPINGNCLINNVRCNI